MKILMSNICTSKMKGRIAVVKTGALQNDEGILRNGENLKHSMHFIAKKLLTSIGKQIKIYKGYK